MNTMRIIAISTLAVFGMAGCGTAPEDAKVTTGTLSSQVGKPGAPVSLSYAVPESKTLGNSIDISLTVTFDSAVDSAEISLSESEGLEMTGAPAMRLGAQKVGAKHEMIVSVIPRQAGLRFVNVFAVTKQGAQELRRTFAVPVAGGGDATPQKGSMPKPAVMPDGERVISLPADEDRN